VATFLTCPQGHTWIPDTLHVPTDRCPVCGEPAAPPSEAATVNLAAVQGGRLASTPTARRNVRLPLGAGNGKTCGVAGRPLPPDEEQTIRSLGGN
jgi:hypothetical protein